jgi:hypothetical protein
MIRRTLLFILAVAALAGHSGSASAQACGYPWTVTATPAGGRTVAINFCGSWSGCALHDISHSVDGSHIDVTLQTTVPPDLCQCVTQSGTFGWVTVPVSPVVAGPNSVTVRVLSCDAPVVVGATTFNFDASLADTLFLNDDRFTVTATFQQTPEGPSAAATAVPLTNDTGYFWFFDPSNIEVVVKVLTGCAVNGKYWVFAGGLTNVGVELKVTDTQTGAVKNYPNPVGTPFQPIQDSSAFPCP